MAKKSAPKKKYSELTKRHATQFPGVYEREAERVAGQKDICFDISYKKDGKKVWEKIGWKSQGYSADLARQVRNERIIAMQHGEELPQEKKKAITFKTLAEKYLKWSSENKNRKGIEDKSRYENHLKTRFDDKRLDEIVLFDLERMKSEMTKAGLSPKTVLHCLSLIRAMFNWAIDRNLYKGGNPIKRKRAGEKKGLMPTIQNARDRYLSIEESEVLLKELKHNIRFKKEYKEVEDPQLHDITLLSLHTGARASEIFNLKGMDINFQSGLITLRDTKNTTTRYSPMTEAVIEMLKGRMPKDGDGKILPNALIFTDEDGGQIKEVSKSFERVVNRLKFNEGVTDPRQRVVFHTCRHTFASWLAIQGIPILTIARLMGHKSISMSERYSHLSPDHKKEAVNGLESAINGHKNKVVDIE
mgnify:CR=1 FL=1